MKWKEENRPLSPSEIYFGKRNGLIPEKPKEPAADHVDDLPQESTDSHDVG